MTQFTFTLAKVGVCWQPSILNFALASGYVQANLSTQLKNYNERSRIKRSETAETQKNTCDWK